MCILFSPFVGDDIDKYLSILRPVLLRNFDFGHNTSVETALSFLRFGTCLLKLLGGVKLSNYPSPACIGHSYVYYFRVEDRPQEAFCGCFHPVDLPDRDVPPLRPDPVELLHAEIIDPMSPDSSSRRQEGLLVVAAGQRHSLKPSKAR